jgi:hypothetical protein
VVGPKRLALSLHQLVCSIVKKRDLISMAENPKFISGIYNYCDRWCERCAFTARCMVFAMEQADRQAPGKADSKNDAFWKQLEGSLKATTELLKEMFEERGIQPDPRELEAIGRERQRKRREVEKHPLAKSAFEYSRMLDRWFKEEKALLLEKEEEVKTKVRLGVAGVREEVAGLTDVVQVLRWYQHQICVKLVRALNANEEREAELAEFPKDSDGSAKVALIGIDRSLAAWTRMKEHFPEHTDDILNFLLHLARLRNAAQAEFPNARSFVRPGFDDASAPNQC